MLGTSHVTVTNMANAYATIASQGTRVTPYFIRTVKGGPGDLDYKVKPAKKAAFDKDVTADTVDAMQQVVKDGTAEYAQTLGRPVAGKTGTTTDNKAAWFDGFTPQLATAVGIYSTGKDGAELSMNNVTGVGELTGATVPLHIWTDYMEVALKGQKVVDFPKRAGLGDDDVYTPPPPPPSTHEHDDHHDHDAADHDDDHPDADQDQRNRQAHPADPAAHERDGHPAR